MAEIKIESYQKPVFFDFKGSHDDFIALMLLLNLEKFTLTGMSITSGFCHINGALQNTKNILENFCLQNKTIAISNATLKNEFIHHCNDICCSPQGENATQIFSNNATLRVQENETAAYMANTMLNNNEKTTIIITGPATNMVQTLEEFPEVAHKIERIFWVAGAFLTDGNVIAPDHDGSAEWNIFADPQSAEKLLSYEIPLTLFPLDTTCQYPVDNYLIYHLENNSERKLSKQAHHLLLPAYKSKTEHYLGSAMPMVYLGMPNIFNLDSKSIKIEQRGTSMGNLYRSTLGNRIKQASCTDEEEFYDYLISSFMRF